jgi:hypothetical protein
VLDDVGKEQRFEHARLLLIFERLGCAGDKISERIKADI